MAVRHDLVDRIRHHTVFKHRLVEILDVVDNHLRAIIRQGDEGEKFYAISSGLVEVRHEDAGGTTSVVATLGAGDFFGEAALLTGKVRNASVVAPVTALFPMVTVLLALIFLKERLGRVQWLGLGLAFVAIYLLSA